MNDAIFTKLDLSRFSDEELQDLIPTIEAEVEKRREDKQKEALEKMQAIAESVGMTPEELLSLPGGRRRRRGGGKGKRGKMLWQHPDDSTKEYRGGKKPDWLKELEEQGIEPLKVENM